MLNNKLNDEVLNSINGGAKSCDREYVITCPKCGQSTIRTNRLAYNLKVSCSGCNEQFLMLENKNGNVVLMDNDSNEHTCVVSN